MLKIRSKAHARSAHPSLTASISNWRIFLSPFPWRFARLRDSSRRRRDDHVRDATDRDVKRIHNGRSGGRNRLLIEHDLSARDGNGLVGIPGDDAGNSVEGEIADASAAGSGGARNRRGFGA